MRGRAPLGALALAAVIATLGGCSGGSRGTTATPTPGSSAAPAAATPSAVPIKVSSHRVGSKYIYLTEQKKNRIVYVLRADSNTSIRLAEGTGRSDFVRPHVTFHGADGRTLVADAPHAQVSENDKSILMTGGARARNDQGMSLSSDTLRYDDATERLYGEGNVIVTTPQGAELRGDHFDYDLRTTEMHVTGDVR